MFLRASAKMCCFLIIGGGEDFFSSYETDGANVHYVDKCICISFVRSVCLPDALRFPFDRVNTVTLSLREEYSTKDIQKILMMEAVCCAVGRTAQTRNYFASSGKKCERAY